MTIRAIVLLLPAVCLALMLPNEAAAGDKLKLFEQNAVASTHASSKNQATIKLHPSSSPGTSADNNDFADCILHIDVCMLLGGSIAAVAALAYGGAASTDYAIDSNLTGIAEDGPKKFGEAVIPFLRFDVNRGYTTGGISAIDARAEAGLGPLAFEIQKTVYREDSPSHSLVITKKHYLYRMLFMPEIEADIGLGSVRMDGIETNKGHSFTARFLIYPTKNVGIEARPVWYTINGNHTAECDISINAGLNYAMLRAGYRWMTTTDHPLNGYFVGISAVF